LIKEAAISDVKCELFVIFLTSLACNTSALLEVTTSNRTP